MVRKLTDWAIHNPLIVILLTVALAAVGAYSFLNVNVEAYPDPAPAIVEVVAQFPGASAEEVERQITIPLEVALAGMPGLKYTRSKSLFGLSHLRNQFEYGIDHDKAKQEVINRLQNATLPNGVTPQISPASPTGEIFRYTLKSPTDSLGRDIYTLSDLKALQDWTLQREFLRVPRIAGVVSSGGTVKRYEIQPDPDRLREHGITLQQLQNALAASNANAGGDYLVQGQTVQVVRGVGLIGGGQDPVQRVQGIKDPREAAAILRAEENRRIKEIRQIVIASVNNVPVRIDNLVDGGPVRADADLGKHGVVVSHLTRQGRVSLSKPLRDREGHEVHDAHGEVVWSDEDDKVQGIVLLRKGQESLPALRDVREKIRELNEGAGRLLPGVQIEPYYNRSELMNVTSETVQENVVVGMVLVTVILLMFLNNIRTALILALNIPLALLFAFWMLYARGKSANLLSIGAVDFGIIVDSSVIIVENIFRKLTAGEQAELPLKDRILAACSEVQRSLFYATIVMVCALLPLFVMKGPEGQIFGPMADTYAFALFGALMLALTISPVLCLLLFRKLKPARDNILVRALKSLYLRQLELCLNHRFLTVGVFGLLLLVTFYVLPLLGREFMPELEEGNLMIRGTFPVNVSLDEAADRVRQVRKILRGFGEVEAVVPQLGRPDDGTDPTGFYNVEIFVPMKPQPDWPVPKGQEQARNKEKLIEAMDDALTTAIPGVDWDFSQIIRDNVMESLSGVKGENSVKVIGPDLDELERIAGKVRDALATVRGVEGPGVFRIKGQSNLEFPIDREKCSYWNVSVGDVQNVIQTAIGGKAVSQMIEGERSFDISVRWPPRLRMNEQAILNIPVDVLGNAVTPGGVASLSGTPITGAATGVSSTGTTGSLPAISGNMFNSPLLSTGAARRRLGDLVTPLNEKGLPDPSGSFIRPGASTISREQGARLIAIKFGVRGRDLAGTVAEAQEKVAPLIPPPYRTEWSGEFQEMEEAEQRLVTMVSLSMVLIFILLYLAFHSLLDACLIFVNVIGMMVGGIWTLLLTGLNFNISAAVGFISILGVAVLEGLLVVSYFNSNRAHGMPLREALTRGIEKVVRPVTMTALTAIFGLLPAALSTRIGSQSQRPLAIVVVGGMIMTLVLLNLLPVVYSFYGHREPVEGATEMGH